MKIAVFGAGAVGGHVAARLGAGAEAAGIEVSAVARGAQLAAILQRGITLWIGAQRYSSPIRATDRPESLGIQDVVFVALKSSVLPAAAPGIAPLIGPDTSIVFAMNGIPWWYLYRCPANGVPRPDLSLLDPGGVLERTVGLERVIGCMINSANEVVEPGVIRNSPGTLNRFTLGEPDGTISRRALAISAAFERAGVAAPVSTTIRVEIWDKLLRNLSTAPICALTGEPIGVIGRHDELFGLAKALMAEGLDTARAHGMRPDVSVERAYGRRPNSPHKSSMLQAPGRPALSGRSGGRARPPTGDRRHPDRRPGLRPGRRGGNAASRHADRPDHRKGAQGGALSGGVTAHRTAASGNGGGSVIIRGSSPLWPKPRQ